MNYGPLPLFEEEERYFTLMNMLNSLVAKFYGPRSTIAMFKATEIVWSEDKNILSKKNKNRIFLKRHNRNLE